MKFFDRLTIWVDKYIGWILIVLLAIEVDAILYFVPGIQFIKLQWDIVVNIILLVVIILYMAGPPQAKITIVKKQ